MLVIFASHVRIVVSVGHNEVFLCARMEVPSAGNSDRVTPLRGCVQLWIQKRFPGRLRAARLSEHLLSV